MSNSNIPISGAYIHNNTEGIGLYNSSPVITNCRITANSNDGVYSSGSNSEPHFGDGNTAGLNRINSNLQKGIFVVDYSHPWLGITSPDDGGYNTLGDNSYYNLYALTTGPIWAQNNYWNTAPPTKTL